MSPFHFGTGVGPIRYSRRIGGRSRGKGGGLDSGSGGWPVVAVLVALVLLTQFWPVFVALVALVALVVGVRAVRKRGAA